MITRANRIWPIRNIQWRKCLPTIAFAAMLIVVSFAANSQQSLRIAAVVNDEMVSVLDLQSKTSLIIALSGLPNSAESRRRLTRQVLFSLIEDKLRLQEAKLAEITASKAEMDRSVAEFERQYKLGKGGLSEFLKRNGVERSVVDDQLEADIVWGKLVRSRFRRSVHVSDEEVESIVADLERNRGKPEYLVSEVFLPAATDQAMIEAEKLAGRLIQQMQSGANFAAIARNFSQSTTAPAGGNLGWNSASQLGTIVGPVAQRLQPGQISAPIRAEDGVHILLLRKRRIAGETAETAAENTIVKLSQLHLAIPPDVSEADAQRILEQARGLVSSANNCIDLDAIGKKNGSPLSGELGTFRIGQLSPKMRSMVEKLPVFQPSNPVRSGDGIIVLMVCDKQVPIIKKRTPEQIRETVRDRLVAERLALAARRHMRDLRRASFIDVRL